MGHTFRKEKTFDDKGRGRNHKQAVLEDINRKQKKNSKNYFFEDDEDYDEYSDAYSDYDEDEK